METREREAGGSRVYKREKEVGSKIKRIDDEKSENFLMVN